MGWRSPAEQPVSLGTVLWDSAASAKVTGDSRSLAVHGIHERRNDMPTKFKRVRTSNRRAILALVRFALENDVRSAAARAQCFFTAHVGWHL